jgi:hypothetical protein
LEIAKVTEQTDERKIRRIIDRVFDPADNEIFYHYCSNETLRLICQNKTLRLSDVNMLNDYAESRWGYHIFEQAASYLLQREQEMPLGITRGFLDCVDPQFGGHQNRAHPVVCSFSRDGDILSQWRAYADGGRGVAIGFGGRAMRGLDAFKLRVEYNQEVQLEEFANALIEIHDSDDGEEFVNRCQTAAILALGYKNPAFCEEREVRCVRMLDVREEQGQKVLKIRTRSETCNTCCGRPVSASLWQFLNRLRRSLNRRARWMPTG